VTLSPLVQSFVLHFGEMGGRWGVNRTVGQIYALLFVSDRPLNAEQITEALGISRPDDIWQILRILAEERRKREIDPTLSLLRDILMETPGTAEERHAQDRMRQMHDLIELLTGWADDVQKLDNDSLRQLLALGAGVSRLLEVKNKISVFAGGGRRANDLQANDSGET
jgi:DNA-binding transcriptional regulator GbsR (MarR family)